MVFLNSLHIYIYIAKLCRTQAESIQIHLNPNISGIADEKAMHMM
jgi:hypothetical protein